MPQMSPYNWFFFNMMFSLLMMIYISYFYYIKNFNLLKIKKLNSPKFNYYMKW